MDSCHVRDSPGQHPAFDFRWLLPERYSLCQLKVSKLMREELGEGQFPDIIGPAGDHGQAFDTEAQVHDRDPDPVFTEGGRGVQPEGRHLHPFTCRVPGIDFGLGTGHIIFRPLLIRPEPEIRISE